MGVRMKNLALAIACLTLLTGCSGVGSGLLGGVLGAGAAGGGYEYNLKRQKDRVEEDFKAGKIDQKEYEIRKDQIARDSFFQK
jgi:major membrane immunogen (membrane-anchored lipoprotein)